MRRLGAAGVVVGGVGKCGVGTAGDGLGLSSFRSSGSSVTSAIAVSSVSAFSAAASPPDSLLSPCRFSALRVLDSALGATTLPCRTRALDSAGESLRENREVEWRAKAQMTWCQLRLRHSSSPRRHCLRSS